MVDAAKAPSGRADPDDPERVTDEEAGRGGSQDRADDGAHAEDLGDERPGIPAGVEPPERSDDALGHSQGRARIRQLPASWYQPPLPTVTVAALACTTGMVVRRAHHGKMGCKVRLDYAGTDHAYTGVRMRLSFRHGAGSQRTDPRPEYR